MLIKEALPICTNAVGQKFSKLFEEVPMDIRENKGKTGQLMEKLCGLKLSSQTTDFEDGELKTSQIRESIFITMIKSWIDDLITDNPKKFENTPLLKKINHLIFMPVNKDSKNPNDWYFKSCYYIEITENTYLYKEIQNDYYKICELMNAQVYKKELPLDDEFYFTKNRKKTNETDGYIHTTNGKFIQIRTKDSGNVHPIYSQRLAKNVTPKSNMAFYFRYC